LVGVGSTKPWILFITITPFAGTLVAIWLLWEKAVNWHYLALFVAFYLPCGLGMTLGFHRMLTHRSFRPHPAVELIFLILGSGALEAPPLEWAATHIKHHARSDQDDDPHSPMQGLFHAHVGWLYKGDFADPKVYCRNLLKDPIVVFVNRTYLIWVTLSLLLPFALGGWTGFVWGGLVRIFITHHVTFSVNSICHTFGRRDFATTDRSRNQWLVGLLAFGEGWHNNHHAFPRSAFHGLQWWQIDITGYVIWALERFGLATDVHRVRPERRARHALAGGNLAVAAETGN